MTGAMKSDEPQETGWRGSREVWLDGALALLVEGGIDAVRIQPLSKRLRIARTSFYWHFRDRETLLAALSDRWVARTSDPMITACAAFAETETEAMLNLISCFLSDTSFDSRLEFAVRSWALQDPAMMARLNDEDERRLAALIAMFHRWGHAALDAETRARAVYLTQIGYISMQTVEAPEVRMPRVAHYVEIFTGKPAQPRELARFFARHHYS